MISRGYFGPPPTRSEARGRRRGFLGGLTQGGARRLACPGLLSVAPLGHFVSALRREDLLRTRHVAATLENESVFGIRMRKTGKPRHDCIPSKLNQVANRPTVLKASNVSCDAD
jgi:hypothetical protein